MISNSAKEENPDANGMGKKDINQLAAGAGVALGGKIMGRGLHILGQIVIARLLGPANFGLYAIGWTILSVSRLIATLGLDKGVIYFAGRTGIGPAHYRESTIVRSLELTVVMSFVVSGTLFLASPYLATSVYEQPQLLPVLRGFAVALFFATMVRTTAAATRITKRMQFTVFSEEVGQPAINLILIILFYLMGLRLVEMVVANVISFVMALVIAVYFLNRLFPEFLTKRAQKPTYGELVRYSLPTAFAGIFTSFVVWIDRLLVGLLLPAADVGIYQAVSQSAVFFAIITSGLNAIFTPMITELYYRNEQARLQDLFRVATKWGLSFAIPISLTIFFIPKEVIQVIFGEEFIGGVTPLIILTVAQLINTATGSVGFLLIMTGRQSIWLLTSGLLLLVNIVANMILIPLLGISGAALGTAVTIFGLFGIGLLQVRHYLQLWPYDRRFIKPVAAALGTTAVLWLILSLTNIQLPILQLMLVAVVAVLVFAGLIIVLGLEQEDRELLQQGTKIVQQIRAKRGQRAS